MEGEVPTVLLGKRSEALHRGAFQPLRDDLVQAENAPVSGPRLVGKGNWRRVQLGEGAAWPFSLAAMTGSAIFGEKRGAAREVGNLRGRERNRVSGEQCGGELAGA